MMNDAMTQRESGNENLGEGVGGIGIGEGALKE
jgi:hypothetical protein